jgi:rhamnogalacturonan endolyase
VDGDGFDEVVYGACTIDHDGKGLYSTGLEHGDALHLSVMDPDRGGLQVWQVHEDETTNGGIAASFRDAKTGTIIWSDAGTADNGRGCCGPLIADTRGWQMWSGVGGLWNTAHTKVGNSPGSDNFTMWWDGSLNRATEDGTSITAYSGATLLTTAGCASNNGTKSTPCLTADIFGDWREEVVYRTTNSDTLRIYTTTTPTTNRLYTLMHDPIYRMSVCSENTAYNQPPEPGIYIGYGMTLPETKPNIRTDLPTTVVGSTLPMPASFLRADICLKVMGDQSFLLPHAIAGAARTVAIYDCSGKLVRKVTTGKEVVNLKKDFGISTGIFVVRARAKEKS